MKKYKPREYTLTDQELSEFWCTSVRTIVRLRADGFDPEDVQSVKTEFLCGRRGSPKTHERIALIERFEAYTRKPLLRPPEPDRYQHEYDPKDNAPLNPWYFYAHD